MSLLLQNEYFSFCAWLLLLMIFLGEKTAGSHLLLNFASRRVAVIFWPGL